MAGAVVMFGVIDKISMLLLRTNETMLFFFQRIGLTKSLRQIQNFEE